ncbi:MAG: transcription factor S [Candidatus Pacearchaeota archaeon]
MEFCKKCGSVLLKTDSGYKCARCGKKVKEKIKIEVSEKIEGAKKIGIIKEKDTDVFPTVSAVCSKCGNKEAYFWTAQTRASDEAETRFFKCKKCNYTWREYT